jgi:hypothetical protein
VAIEFYRRKTAKELKEEREAKKQQEKDSSDRVVTIDRKVKEKKNN